MPSTTNGKQRYPAATRISQCCSLSVVVVSSGKSAVAQRAAKALRTASQDFAAQFIVVSQNADPGFASTVERTGVEVVVAPPGSTRAEMCDLGMSRASGAIVAVRDDVAVGDAHWLDTYRGVLPKRELPALPSAVTESVVMDTMVAGHVGMADGAQTVASGEPRARVASSEMAAAV
jgi:hypothetical protein